MVILKTKFSVEVLLSLTHLDTETDETHADVRDDLKATVSSHQVLELVRQSNLSSHVFLDSFHSV